MEQLDIIRGDEIVGEIERGVGDVTALPLAPEPVSLINEAHIKNLNKKMKWDDKKSFDNLGLKDKREKEV